MLKHFSCRGITELESRRFPKDLTTNSLLSYHTLQTSLELSNENG